MCIFFEYLNLTSAVPVAEVRESPDISEVYREADDRQQEVGFLAPRGPAVSAAFLVVTVVGRKPLTRRGRGVLVVVLIGSRVLAVVRRQLPLDDGHNRFGGERTDLSVRGLPATLTVSISQREELLVGVFRRGRSFCRRREGVQLHRTQHVCKTLHCNIIKIEFLSLEFSIRIKHWIRQNRCFLPAVFGVLDDE